MVAEEATRSGATPLVVLIEGEVEDPSSYAAYQCENIRLESASALLPILRRNHVGRVVLAGAVARRPRLRDLKWDMQMLSWLPPVARALWQGDNVLLSALIGILENRGIRVVGAHEIAPDLLAIEGVMTRVKPAAADLKDISAAREAAELIGRLDIGQAAISVGGRVVALEGIEGTELLLERTVALRDHGRIAGKTGGVLVKVSKPQQELRADLPTIGPRTVEFAHRAKLAGIAVEAGRSFVLDGPEVIRQADSLGLFVIGLPAGER